jgi:hypothetical protein
MFAFLLRLLGNLGFYAGRFIVNVYDLIIFPAIWLEGIFRGSRSREMEMSDSKTPQDSPLVQEAVSSFEEPIKLEEQQE